MADAFRVDFDLASITDQLDQLHAAVNENVRPAAQAGAQVLYDEVLVRVPERTGRLKQSVYQVYSKDNSGEGKATYHISWNRRTAPHGHLIEFGTVQMAARPFLRPAYDAQARRAAETVNEVLAAGIRNGSGGVE